MREGIILAGGFGTRLREIVPNMPKPMAMVAGKPFLEILLQLLARKKFKRIVLSVGFKSETIINYFNNDYAGMKLTYVVEKEPLGTGGAVRLAMEQVHSDHAFVFNGDTFLNLEVDAVEEQWRLKKNQIIVGREVLDTSRYGRILFEGSLITGFAEKGASGQGVINAGSYLFNKADLMTLPLNQPFSLELDYLAHTVHKQATELFLTTGQFIDIGIPEDYYRAQNELKSYS
jgi:D-glycero-alpha-D-manno-heptose 1-phosphate guanylyltransferase